MIVQGKNVCMEVIKTNKKIKNVYLQNDFKDEEILNLLGNRFNIKYLDKKKLDNMCENNQGIILEIEDYKYYPQDKFMDEIDDKSFIVILDHLQDPHNFGAIIRTCEAANVDFIVIPKDRSVKVNSTVMKVSAGALNRVRIVQVTNLNNIIKKLKEKNIWVVATDLNTNNNYTDVDYKSATAIVIGNEGSGVSRLVKENCDFLVKIPMIGKINSLNASVATGIMIYEVIRQRGNNE